MSTGSLTLPDRQNVADGQFIRPARSAAGPGAAQGRRLIQRGRIRQRTTGTPGQRLRRGFLNNAPAWIYVATSGVSGRPSGTTLLPGRPADAAWHAQRPSVAGHGRRASGRPYLSLPPEDATASDRLTSCTYSPVRSKGQGKCHAGRSLAGHPPYLILRWEDPPMRVTDGLPKRSCAVLVPCEIRQRIPGAKQHEKLPLFWTASGLATQRAMQSACS